MATVALAEEYGGDRTFSTGLSRRTTHRLTMMVERFALWHRVEARADVWASAGALAIAGFATVLVFVVRPF